ncbi:hypothetical protein HOC01_03695 [archaeon]|jgi:hypothetical protein|nr:hypothetical protein [archaeon]MBT6698485.1 hypothetical protein [archaeon]
MNKRESLSLGIFLVCLFLLGVVLFSGMNTDMKVKLENGNVISSKVPIHFGLVSVVFLMLLSFVGAWSLQFYISDLSKKISMSKKQETTLAMLEGDTRRMYLFILEREYCLQKDLVYELGMPKVKVSRLLDKLSEKGIVQRISYGKTNKIVAV